MATGKGGLEGIIAGKTALSMVDGQQGRLTYRGYDIHDLATHASYEEVVHLLWHGNLPNARDLADTREKLA
jgi:citrate synthase